MLETHSRSSREGEFTSSLGSLSLKTLVQTIIFIKQIKYCIHKQFATVNVGHAVGLCISILFHSVNLVMPEEICHGLSVVLSLYILAFMTVHIFM